MKKYYFVPVLVLLVLSCGCVNTPPQSDVQNLKQALTSEDTSACERIQDKVMAGACLLNLAVIKDDASICGKITTAPELKLKDKCYMKVGSYKKDASICNSIQDAKLKGDCLGAQVR